MVIDLIGYRRHGHSEVDDPTITQPLLYERIKNHPPLWKIYAQLIGIDAAPIAEAVKKEFAEEQRKAARLTKIPQLRKLPDYWSPYNLQEIINIRLVSCLANLQNPQHDAVNPEFLSKVSSVDAVYSWYAFIQ